MGGLIFDKRNGNLCAGRWQIDVALWWPLMTQMAAQ